MDHFEYRQGVLHCESVTMSAIAERFGTPTFVYSKRTFVEHFNRIRVAFAPVSPTICYSVKCCQNLAILRLLREQGAGFDVVSGGELRRALEAGADPSMITFAGVGKTDDEIRAGLSADIGWFNVESEAELDNIATIAASISKQARVALRVNPDVDPKTHRYTTTGKRETKFGIDLERTRRVFKDFAGQPSLDLAGIHIHIGSPVNTIEPYVQAVQKTLTLIDELAVDGYVVRAINLGGGYGAHYDENEAPPALDYAQKLLPLLENRNLQVLLEPGRSIAANAGVLLCRTLYTKASGDKQFVIVDAAMTELIRPALYESFHFTWPVEPVGQLVPTARSASLHLDGTVLVDIVGPVCESGDFLAKDRWLPSMSRSDLVVVFSAGAYGMVMSSQYNSRPRAAEVLVDGEQVTLIRRRETYDDLVTTERL